MKKLFFIFTLFLSAFSFISVMPPGWYQQTLPVNDFINDIYFIDTLTGWAVTQGHTPNNDTAYIMKTTNGGDNWQIQFTRVMNFNVIQFLNSSTGYAGGGSGNGNKILYKTTNGGSNWNLTYTSNFPVESLFFINSQKGWIRGGTTNGVLYTTNGGVNWNNAQGENAPYDIKFINDSIGYAGGGNQPLRIAKSTDGGKTWGYQTAQATPNINVAILKGDTSHVWAGRQLLIHTTDGGGAIIYTSVQQISSEIPAAFSLYQNYPNPFNPATTIEFELQKTSDIRLEIFNITGRVVGGAGFVKRNPGKYKYEFKAEDLSSGVYFYRLIANGVLIDTKKMLMVK